MIRNGQDTYDMSRIILYKIMTEIFNGKSSQRWTDTKIKNNKRINTTFNKSIASNREQCRGIIEVIKDLNGSF